MSLTVIQPKPPRPILPMAWLDWRRDGDEYVGGEYRIRLVEPYRWEALREGQHLFFDTRLSSALTRADHDYRDRLRRRDLFTWSAVFVACSLFAALIERFNETLHLWEIPLLALAVYGALAGLVRFYAAWTRSRFDPYRRLAPWERRRRRS